MHPMMAERMDIWRLREFELERLPSAQDVYLFRAVARDNPSATSAWSRSPRCATSRRCATRTAASSRCRSSSGWCARRSRRCAPFQSRRPPRERLHWNRLLLYAWPAIDFEPAEAGEVITRFARMSAGLGLEMVQLRLRIGDEDRVLRIFNPAGRGVAVELGDPPTRPLQPLDEGAQRIVSARRRGLVHPAEIVKISPASSRRRSRPASTTSTTTASSSRSTGRPPPTPRASWSG